MDFVTFREVKQRNEISRERRGYILPKYSTFIQEVMSGPKGES